MKKSFNMKKINLFIVCAALLIFTGCSNKSADGSYSSANSRTRAMKIETSMEPAFAEDSEAGSDNFTSENTSGYENDRKLIKTGNVTVEVENFDSIEKDIKAYAAKFGGYITDTYSDEDSVTATIKVPCEKFEEAMNEAGNIGKVKSSSENSQDVTLDYYDLESRINTKKLLKEKLESYLNQAGNMTDLLEIEKQLNEVISDLDSMESRMKKLSNQISYSTVYLNVRLPFGKTDSGYDFPDLGEKFKELGYNILSFLAGFLMALIYIVIFGIPVIAVIALLYWLLFGRIGLLRKLFKVLSKKKE